MNPSPSGAEHEQRIADARGKVRMRPDPAVVEPVGAGEESVWRYPRPPRVERVGRDVRVRVGTTEIVCTQNALRVLETSGPPSVYVPEAELIDVRVVEREDWALCEWKGVTRYIDLVAGGIRAEKAGWRIPAPLVDLKAGYEALVGHVALYPAMVECWIGDLLVTPQAGGYYGGWVTPEIRGPFKGPEGTEDW